MVPTEGKGGVADDRQSACVAFEASCRLKNEVDLAVMVTSAPSEVVPEEGDCAAGLGRRLFSVAAADRLLDVSPQTSAWRLARG